MHRLLNFIHRYCGSVVQRWETLLGQISTRPTLLGFPGVSDNKESACSTGDLGSIPGLGRSPGEGNGYSLQYSFLENSMDRGASWATVQGVAKSWTQLRLTFSLLSLIVGKYLISFIFFVGYLLRDLWIYYHRVKWYLRYLLKYLKDVTF